MGSSIYECRDREYLRIKKYNITLVNFEVLMYRVREVYKNLLDMYAITDTTSKDGVKLLYHCIITELCNLLQRKKTCGDVMIYFNTEQNTINVKEITLLLSKMPWYTVCYSNNMEEFEKRLNEKDHMAIEVIEQSISLRKDSVKKYRAFYSFLKKYELQYMMNTFLKQHCNKMMLFR